MQLFQLPHMLPSEEAFAAAVSALGIKNTDKVIVYDGKGFFSAPRVWW
jgi:thiosulfate/3-mercaptopyruvate sulfurtransferase